ncbi:tyrosine-type recombinase/integrase [uncultured Alteromonas sp.]|jgi:integrase|uniref:tyrosine-type recombinase/integrase n=1 Tax=uncultured Alteromonas sp. TaxID=179113 RepID=UPI002587C8DF|nr:tyrosine-type recombinase/integrase [uncultured Alteromonas sp.]
MAKQIARHDINDELYIFKQDNSERWYARFILTNHKKWLCKSTKKKDKDEAIAMAHRIFLDHQIRHENNTLVQSKRFTDVADRVIEKLEVELEHGGGKRTYKDYIRALENYHIPYFSRTFITSIDQEAISKFVEWRKGRMNKPPASSTLLTHNAALNLVFKEAIEQKWMIAAQVPVLSSKGEAGTRRAAFSEEEYDAVLDEIYESEQNAHSEKTRQIRELLYDYCEIAVNTGIRPGTEMENLTWKDIEIKTQGAKAQFFIHVTKGKTTKYTGARKVVCKRDVIGALIRLRERFPLRTPNQKIFLLANGEATPQLGKAFEKALQSSGLKDSQRGPRTLYSLRHTYITWQLLAGTSMDVIARQCGTSAAMIEQHYSHVKPEMFADALSGVTFDEDKPKTKSKKTLARQERSMERDEKRFKEWAAEYKKRGCI